MILNQQTEDFPESFYGVIEIPKNSKIKYEYNPVFNMIEFDRELSNSMIYPGNYGFIPNTLAEDGDPVDIVMLDTDPSMESGTLVKLKPLGLLTMFDCGNQDHKILTTSSKCSDIHDAGDVYSKFLAKAKDFFKNYKNLDEQNVRVEQWRSAKFAKEYLKDKILRK